MNRQDWEIWEDDVTDGLHAKKVRASGRLTLYKADVKSNTMLIDCKHTSGRSYAVTGVFWDEISMWARNEMREPAVAIRCENPERFEAAVVREQWYCEHFGVNTSGRVTRDGLSKTISANCLLEKDEFVFEVGGHRLVAMPYQQFRWKVLEIEG